eukprot:TRINITY_DN78304_c0_g1_i1.p1 TRINITY_DN78304_c0_g1~~TRINITY_DN78304_c0_g1_i1.p1  ORF type:complete len:202 (-),score=24.56 TRINITY_DN78304_c0_g1_i1:88-693(-)
MLEERNKKLEEDKESREQTFALADLGTLVVEYFLPNWRLISDTLAKAHPKLSSVTHTPTWEEVRENPEGYSRPQVSEAAAAKGGLTGEDSPSVLELWNAKVSRNLLAHGYVSGNRPSEEDLIRRTFNMQWKEKDAKLAKKCLDMLLNKAEFSTLRKELLPNAPNPPTSLEVGSHQPRTATLDGEELGIEQSFGGLCAGQFN